MKRTPAALALTLVLAAALAQAPSALAQGSDPKQAELLFQSALEDVENKNFESACPKFRKSQELDPAPGTLFNLAECEERRGRLAAALLAFQELAGGLPPNDKRTKELTERIAKLELRVPRLTLKLAEGAPEDTEVTRDGEKLAPGELGAPIPVDPGRHQITATAEGRSRAYSVELPEGESRELEVTPIEEAPAEGAGPGDGAGISVGTPGGDPRPAPGGGSSKRTLGFVIGGVGLVGLGASMVTGALVLGKKSDVEDNCPGGRCRDQSGVDAAESGQTLSLVSTIAFGVGVVGVGVGTYLILSSPKEAKAAPAAPPTSASRAPTPSRAWVGLAPTPGGARLSLGKSF